MRLPSRQACRAFGAGMLVLASTACDADRIAAPASAADAVRDTAALAAAVTVTPSATLPQKTVSLAFPSSTGKTITVKAGGSLQGAINAALPGDVIVLQAGATFTGNFTLPKKSGTGWVTIRTSTPDNLLPVGRRVIPSQASLLARVVSHNSMPAIRTYAGAHHYRLIGLEIATTTSPTSSSALVSLGEASNTQTSLTQVPTNLVIERSYIHGRSTLNLKNCVTVNSAHTAIVDSYLERCHSNLQESHAIIGWNGPGPFRIENNYIEGAGINVMFGGAPSASTSLVPSDITIRRNHIMKPLAWKGVWTVKNLLELKIGRRILIEANILENSWVDAQTGAAFLFKTEVGSNANTWGRTEEVTVRYNVIRNVAIGATLSGRSGSYGLPARDIRFEHNVWDGVGSSNGTGAGRGFQVLPGVNNVQFERNTIVHNSSTSSRRVIVFGGSGADSNLVFRDNITTRASYAVKGDGYGEGTASLARYAPRYVFAQNVMAGALSGSYPAGNYFPSSATAIGFVSLSGKDYRLASTSPYKGKASHGGDPGADVAAVTSRTAGVIRR